MSEFVRANTRVGRSGFRGSKRQFFFRPIIANRNREKLLRYYSVFFFKKIHRLQFFNRYKVCFHPWLTCSRCSGRSLCPREGRRHTTHEPRDRVTPNTLHIGRPKLHDTKTLVQSSTKLGEK